MIRGYPVYQAVWDAQIGEELSCVTECENVRDPFTVAVKKSNLTVGHIPKKISALCSLFLLRGGTITCQVTGSRRYSDDLVQGGLEIPCALKFKGDAKLVNKVKKNWPRNLSSLNNQKLQPGKKRMLMNSQQKRKSARE